MPSEPDPDLLRIGTAEREEACSVLGEHFGAGRLTVEEYEQRVSSALAAQTKADVRPLFEDLPTPRPSYLMPPAEPRVPSPPSPPYNPYAVSARVPPAYPVRYSDKSKIVAGVLQIAVPFGAGRFYTGHTGMAVAQLLVTLFTFGIGAIWPVIDGILLLANGGQDRYGRHLRD